MLVVSFICFFVWFIVSFVVVADMFRKHTAMGCLGLILLPILPFIWVVKGYTGDKRKVGGLLYGSAILGLVLVVTAWKSASDALEPFLHSAESVGMTFRLQKIGFNNGEDHYSVIAEEIYTPVSAYTSVEEMLAVIQREKVEALSAFYPDTLEEGMIIKIVIPTSSGFNAVYEVSGPSEIREIYTVTP